MTATPGGTVSAMADGVVVPLVNVGLIDRLDTRASRTGKETTSPAAWPQRLLLSRPWIQMMWSPKAPCEPVASRGSRAARGMGNCRNADWPPKEAGAEIGLATAGAPAVSRNHWAPVTVAPAWAIRLTLTRRSTPGLVAGQVP